MTIRLEPVTPADYSQITEVYNSARELKRQRGDYSWDDGGNFNEAEIRAMDNQNFLFKAVSGLEIVGAVMLSTKDTVVWGNNTANALYLNKLGVKAEHAHMGLGRDIVLQAEELAKTKGYSIMRLDCRADNTGLCHYYERLGYGRVDVAELPSGNWQKFEKQLR